MPYYEIYLTDTDKDGDLEVHKSDCRLTSGKIPFRTIGYHLNCQKAIEYVKTIYIGKTIDGCKICIPECHKR